MATDVINIAQNFKHVHNKNFNLHTRHYNFNLYTTLQTRILSFLDHEKTLKEVDSG